MLKSILNLILLFATPITQLMCESDKEKGALLQAEIKVFSTNETKEEEATAVRPGSFVRLTALVANVGDLPSEPAEIFIRFAFPKPLSLHTKSLIFKTETKKVPMLAPGESIVINFETTHKWPTIFEFVRNDWAMREYEAVIHCGRTEKIIGDRAIAFSAYYYQGHQQAFPTEVEAVEVPQTTP